jgi:hypothetical protein
MEASPNPERAVAAADRLRNLQPALAHTMHMPSHVEILTGIGAGSGNERKSSGSRSARPENLPGCPKVFLMCT